MSSSEAERRARLRDIERHLADMPPHNASGSRDELERQRVALQRELAGTTRSPTGPRAPVNRAEPVDPRQGAPRAPSAATPVLAPGAFRRTTHVAAGPVPGADYGDGLEVERDLHGACRDVRRDATSGEIMTLDEASIVGQLDLERRMTRLELRPGPTPATLLGQPALPGLRGLVAAAVPDTTTASAAVLLDLGIGGNLSAYGRMQAGRQSGKTTSEVMRSDVLEVLGDSCRGWAVDGDVATAIREGIHRPAGSPAEVPIQDDDGWHDLGELPLSWVRRRRRIDVVPADDGARRVEAAFRDSWMDRDGVERALHEWELSLEVDVDGIVTSATAVPRSLPFGACPLVADDVPALLGAEILGLRQRTAQVLGGAVGCTHLNDLLSTIPSAVIAATHHQEP